MKNCIGWLLLCFWLCLAGLCAWGASDFIFNYVEENNNDRYDDKPCVLARVAHGDDGDSCNLAALYTGRQSSRAARAAKTQSGTTKEMPRVLTATQIRQLWGVEGSIRELEEEGGLVTIKYSRRNVDKIMWIQRVLGIKADGRMGKETLDAMIKRLGGKASAKPRLQVYTPSKVIKPLRIPTLRELRSGKSVFGKPGPSQLVNIIPPYQLYYGNIAVETIQVHRLAADRMHAALSEVLRVYGHDEIKRLGLDRFSGAYCFRRSRGGSEFSSHAWGIAADFYASRNGLRTPTSQALFARPEYRAWIEAWEKYDFQNLGKLRGADWMHFQLLRSPKRSNS